MSLKDTTLIRINNLVYGENTHIRNLERHRKELFIGSEWSEAMQEAFVNRSMGKVNIGLMNTATATLTYTIPNPQYVVGEDNSHWDGIVDYSQTYNKGMRFTFIKVTDGTYSTAYFTDNYPSSQRNNLLAGAYHWLYRDANVSCKAQANATWNRMKNVKRELPLSVDFEWTYWNGVQSNPNWQDLDMYLTEWLRLGGEKPLLYTAAGYANPFGQIPNSVKSKICGLWVANYGVSSPTLPMGFTSWLFWQFTSTLSQDYYSPSSKGKKELDGNYWYSTESALRSFANATGGSTVDPTYTITNPYDGVRRAVGRYKNSDFYMNELDPKKVRIEVKHDPSGDGLARPSDICKKYGAQLAWNGDEYNKHLTELPHKPVEYAMSNGVVYVPRTTAVPSLNVSQDGIASIGNLSFVSPYNITSGYRYLIVKGTIQSYLYGTEIQYVERHPRSCFGLTQDGKVLSLTIDGRSQKSAGATLAECAELLYKFGAYYAYDRGSGGDSVDVMDGIVQNVPADLYPDGSNGAERAVSQFVLAFANSNTGGLPPVAEINIKLKTNDPAKARNIRSNAPSGQAHIYGTTFSSITASQVGSGNINDKYVYATDVFNGATKVAQKGDIWHKVRALNDIALTSTSAPSDANGKYGWVAEIHLGVRQLVVETIAPPPVDPPPAETFPTEIWISMTQGGTQKKYVLVP